MPFELYAVGLQMLDWKPIELKRSTKFLLQKLTYYTEFNFCHLQLWIIWMEKDRNLKNLFNVFKFGRDTLQKSQKF